jgi:CPA2 family monovalent cation:H+ antiporter-2
MLFDPNYLFAEPGLAAATLAIILLGKPLAALLIVLLLKYPLRVALSIAVVLAQIGEFSFILSSLGKNLGILDDRATNTIVAAAIISISINPLLFRLIDSLEAWLRQPRRLERLPSPARAPREVETDEGDGRFHHRTVIVGYGPVGRTVARLLRENEVEPTVIEINLETVRRLREAGTPVIYGDASHYETLQAAEVKNAVSFIISTAGMRGSAEVIRLAKELNPKIRVLVRSSYLHELPALRQAGADAVFSGEGEVALTMMEFILRQLGATPEQIDRERERIREELFGSAWSVEPAETALYLCKLKGTPPCQILQHCNNPTIQQSNIPMLHHFNTPLLHQFATSVLPNSPPVRSLAWLGKFSACKHELSFLINLPGSWPAF